MDEKNIKFLTKLRSALEDDAITRAEFVKAFQEVVKLTTTIEQNLIKKINTEVNTKVSSGVSSLQEMKNEMAQVIAEVKKSNDSTFAGIKKRAMESMSAMFAKMDIQGKMDRMYQEHETMMSAMSDRETEMEKKMSEMKMSEIHEETAEETRDKLETLKEEDEKLKIDAVGFLKEKLNELEKKIAQKSGHAVFASQRGAVKAYPISDQLNGVLKTFTLPAFWTVISVHTSSVPNILQVTTDYTTDASVPSITFTDAISASSTLAEGQTVVIVYSEP